MAQNEERRWVGDQPVRDPPARRWVVWGTGARFPRAPFAYGVGNDVAEGIVRTSDPDWLPGWLAIVEADEQTIDEWSIDSGGRYAPYLINGKTEEVAGPMSGTLRSDVAPRRKVDQPRPS